MSKPHRLWLILWSYTLDQCFPNRRSLIPVKKVPLKKVEVPIKKKKEHSRANHLGKKTIFNLPLLWMELLVIFGNLRNLKLQECRWSYFFTSDEQTRWALFFQMSKPDEHYSSDEQGEMSTFLSDEQVKMSTLYFQMSTFYLWDEHLSPLWVWAHNWNFPIHGFLR